MQLKTANQAKDTIDYKVISMTGAIDNCAISHPAFFLELSYEGNIAMPVTLVYKLLTYSNCE